MNIRGAKTALVVVILGLLGVDLFLRYKLWQKPLLQVPEPVEVHCARLGFTGYSYKLTDNQETIIIRCTNP